MKPNEYNSNLSNPWSFRNKEETKNEFKVIDKLKEKVNQTLIKSRNINKKKDNKETTTTVLEDEEKNFIDLLKKNTEKELEIFDSERRDFSSPKNKGSLINIDCTLSNLNIGKGTFVTKDDLIIDLPSCFSNKTKMEDVGNTYTINVNEINKLVPNDTFIAQLHTFYSQNRPESKNGTK